jgi:hypothetical protein
MEEPNVTLTPGTGRPGAVNIGRCFNEALAV